MSHQPERKEKNCLNCGAEVQGRFCHRCGQENIVTHQSFWSLTKHFVYDVLHFDGKFFHTVGYIFSRPGYVAKQYAEGKRMSFLDPIRMYLFTSAVFFLVFFSVSKVNLTKSGSASLSAEDRRELAAQYEERIRKTPADSFLRNRIPLLLDTTRSVDIDSLGWGNPSDFLGGRDYSSVREYDSVQNSLPPEKRDGFARKLVVRRGIQVNKQYGNGEKLATVFLNTFIHQLPYLLFVSLPFFALILKLLYSRRKNFFYSDHAVFTLYHYIFSFILLLVMLGVKGLQNLTGWGVFGYLLFALMLSWPVYLFIELKNFYRQGAAKTLGKFLLLNMAGMLVLLLLFILFFVLSVFQI